MAAPSIARLQEPNVPGACRLDLVSIDQVLTFPEEVFGRLPETIGLVVDEVWSTIYGTRFTQDFKEVWRQVNGSSVADASCGLQIPKDRVDLLSFLWDLQHDRFIALHHSLNNTIKVMGTLEEPASVRIEKLTHGRGAGDRNEYVLMVEVSRRSPCPFYLGDAPLAGTPGGVGGGGGVDTPITGTEGTLGTEDTANMEIL